MLCVTTVVLALGCAVKKDPVPRPRAAPAACQGQWLDRWRLSVLLPASTQPDAGGRRESLRGLHRVRVLYLPLSGSRPTAPEVVQRGDVILERAMPDLPRPGERLVMDFTGQERGPGWIVVVASRVGEVAGDPGSVLPWLHPAIR